MEKSRASSLQSPYPNTARYAATSAILTATSSKSDRAPTLRTVNPRRCATPVPPLAAGGWYRNGRLRRLREPDSADRYTSRQTGHALAGTPTVMPAVPGRPSSAGQKRVVCDPRHRLRLHVAASRCRYTGGAWGGALAGTPAIMPAVPEQPSSAGRRAVRSALQTLRLYVAASRWPIHLLADDDSSFIWTSLAHTHGLPVIPEWGEWFVDQLQMHRAIVPLVGLGCNPVLIKGNKQQFLSWLSWGSEKRTAPSSRRAGEIPL